MGLAPKYHGPFLVVGTNKNGCDYLIKRLNSPRPRVKQVHKNNLKMYFDRGLGHDQPEDITASQPPATVTKRAYNKNPNNPRWNINPVATDESALDSESDPEPTAAEQPTADDESSNIEDTVTPKNKKQNRTNNTKAAKHHPEPTGPATATFSRRGRTLRPPTRFQ